MQQHSLVLAALTGVIGLVAGRATRTDRTAVAAAAPPAACPAPAIARVAPALETAPEPPEPEPDEGGTEVAEVLAYAQQHAAAEARLRHDAILGHVVNTHDGSALVGCTVVATSPALATTQTAISDEHGDFAIYDLPAGSYTLTYYYGSTTVERTGIAVSDLDVSRVASELDPDPPVTFSSSDGFEDTIIIEGGGVE